MEEHAVFSRCGRYRFALWRTWDVQQPSLHFIGLNPCCREDTNEDRVINRYLELAKRWGFGSISVSNLFAFCCNHPLQLQIHSSPIGDNNNSWLKSLHFDADVTVAAWGTHGQLHNRANWALRELKNLYCMDINVSGQPSHPLLISRRVTIKPLTATHNSLTIEPLSRKRA